jgi:hypothetical protein
MQYRLGPSGILAAWETGAPRRPLDRCLAILWAAGAEDDPADWTLWERDRQLLRLREETFGGWLPARATCPACEAELEMDLDVRALADYLLPGSESRSALLPLTSRDLAAVAGVLPDQRAATLRDRLAAAATDGIDTDTLDQQIEAAARASELTTRLSCPECGHTWSEALDVAAHLWVDVESAALRLLDDVARLALRYGWAEADILAMSPARRRAYLQLAGQA